MIKDINLLQGINLTIDAKEGKADKDRVIQNIQNRNERVTKDR